MYRVLHVRVAEPGGGAGHLELAVRTSGETSASVLELSPSDLRLRRWRRAATRVDVAVRASGADIIHAHGIRAAIPCALTAGRSGRAMVLTVHGSHSLRRFRGPAWVAARALNRWVATRAERIIVLSESDRSLFATLVDPRKVVLMHPPSRSPELIEKNEARSALSLPPSGFVALWVGRLENEKDPLTFARAIRLLGDPMCVGLIVGDGTLKARVEALNEPRLQMTGWLEDVSNAYASADVYVNTSLWEGASLSALEAAGCGLPLVLSAAPGNVDLEALLGATTFEVGNAKGLARVLFDLRDDVNKRVDLGRKARAGLSSFHTQDSWQEAMTGVYTAALEAAHRTDPP